jgi:hypothetical protein
MHKKIFLLLTVIVLIIFFTGLGCKKTTKTAETQTSALFTDDPAKFDEEFNQIKNTADEKARNWRSDAKLVYVNVKIPLNLDLALVQHTFVYDSANDSYNHWVITIETANKSFIRSLIPKTDYLGTAPQEILASFLQVNFIKALQTCDKGDGQDFRSQNPSNYQIELNLVRTTEESLRWKCKYSTFDETKTKEIIVNAETGEIIK